jgi:CBS domain-containing protein
VKVRDLMRTRGLLTVTEEDSIAAAQRLMGWGGVRHVPVLREGKVIGVLTDHDVLRYRAETGGGGAHDAVRLYMSSPAVTVAPDADLAHASALMVGKRISSLVVVDAAGRLVGVLTTTDLVASHVALGPAPARPPSTLTTADAMHVEVATVHPYQPLMEAVGLMVDRQIRHVTVIDDDGRVVGIVSDRDVRTAIGDPVEALHTELEELEEMKVSTVMTTPVLTVREETPLADLAKRFVDERIGAIPIVDERHRPVGIVSYVDVIQALGSALGPELPREAEPSPEPRYPLSEPTRRSP